MSMSLSKIVSICALCVAYFAPSANAIAFLLQKSDPYCFKVQPRTPGAKLSVSYMVTGMNEDQVNFTVSIPSTCILSSCHTKHAEIKWTEENKTDMYMSMSVTCMICV